MRQMAIEMSGSKDYKVSLIQSSIVIIGEDLLNGSKTMKMLSHFSKMALLGQKTWNDDEIKKRRFLQNAQNISLVDSVFE
jgi:hypothetical protein